MKHYADSSFLVSCYLFDQNTSAAKAWLDQAAVALPFTELHALEVRNAFQLGLFRNLLTRADVKQASANLQSDLRAGRLITTAVDWSVALRIATGLSVKHSAATGARSLDILHLAAARSMRATNLISFDIRQRLLAATIRLKVGP